LNESAANALLKTLEEPPAETHLFLVTARPHHLLPTILSRCQWVKFKPLSQSHIAQILQAQAPLSAEQAYFYSSLSGGSASRALSLGERMDFQKRLDWLKTFGEVFQKSPLEILDLCAKIYKEEEEVQDLLELWKFWVRDLLVYQVAGAEKKERFINLDCLPDIALQARQFTLDQLQDFFRQIAEMQRFIDMKVNRQLALETLMQEMRKKSREAQAV
jgi:DNA polymerase III subunit delta'